MNLILLTPDDYIAEQRVVLRQQRFEQIAHVHKSLPGDSVRVGDIDGLMGSGHIVSMDAHQVEIAVTLDTPPPAKIPLTLLLALPRPKMLRRILRSIAELGVESLVLINSFKVEKSYWSSPVLQPDRIRQYLVQGLQQARDTRLPEVQLRHRFKPFVEDELPAMARHKQALVAHPGARHSIAPHGAGPSVLAIGPEGGFIDYEVDKLAAAGLVPMDLGPRIYRVENAVSYSVGKLFG